MRIPTVLVDTREQDPWTFKGRRVRLKPVALRQGDYSVQGCSGEGGILIERKSVEDLFGTMTKGGARFDRELERIRGVGYAFSAVLVEGDLERVSLGSRWSQADPARILDLFYTKCIFKGVAPYLAGGRSEAEGLAWRLLYGFWSKGGLPG